MPNGLLEQQVHNGTDCASGAQIASVAFWQRPLHVFQEMAALPLSGLTRCRAMCQSHVIRLAH